MTAKIKVPGASKNNPRTVVKTSRKKVTPALASDSADLSVAAMTDTGATAGAALSPARAAIQAALGQLTQVVVSVQPYLRVIPPGAGKNRGGRVKAAAAAQMTHMVELFRTRPDVVSADRLDAIDEDRALAADLHQLSAQLTVFQSQVNDTDRLTLVDAWTGLSGVYGLARHRARKDNGLATLIDPLRIVLKRGSRTATSQRAADVTQRQLDAAQQRATRAQHKADLAQQHADLLKQAQTLAAARRIVSVAVPPPAPAPVPAPAPAPTPGVVR